MLKELLNKKAAIEQQMQDLQATIEPELAIFRDQIADINLQIGTATQDKLAQLRTMQGKEYGVVNLVLDGVKIKQEIPKKVTWDQDKLAEMFDKITASGDNPRNYMKVKLEVPEKVYEKLVPEAQAMFAEARTVAPGNPTLKFEEVDA